MIEKLSIKNFKSIKDLEIDCKKVNLFIGEPNAGKSNILEALGLISWCGYRNTGLNEYVRFQNVQNLFYDSMLDLPVEIEMGNRIREKIEMRFETDRFRILSQEISKEKELWSKPNLCCDLDYQGNVRNSASGTVRNIKFYRFMKLTEFPDMNASFLTPPHGSNMFSVVMGHKNLRETVAMFFKDYGFRLVLKPMEKVFEFQKQIEDMVFDYPYILLSDTLQRMIFYEIAMESNKDSTIVFEEPEAHTFPYYTKRLGEKIGFDETNQYFIATHNPYLLLSILEKTKRDSVNVFITYFRDEQTKVKCLSGEEVSMLMDYDPFANLDSLVEEKE